MFIQADKKKRLSLDVIGQLEDDLEADPLDYNKWNKLIQQVLAKDKEEQVKSVFNKYLNIFNFDVCIITLKYIY
jgi:cleavage stimulation factor subunit 3